MTFKKASLLIMAILMSKGVLAANLPVKTEQLTANIKSQATLSVQWVPSTIYGVAGAVLRQNMGVLTINSSHVSKISIISTEANPRSGIMTFSNRGANAGGQEWIIVGIQPISGVNVSDAPAGFVLTPSNGQANFTQTLPIQFFAKYVSGGGGSNGNDVTSGQYTATVNITTEIG